MSNCLVYEHKPLICRRVIESFRQIEAGIDKKMNLIWLEACGCSGNIISLLNADDPDVIYFLEEMVNLTYNNSLMGNEGTIAFEKFLETLETDYILVVEGAVSLKSGGLYNVIARYEGELITGMQAIKMASEKAKYILSVGSCASYGGPSSAKPNLANCISVFDFLNQEVIRIPGCPSHPQWVIGTIAHLLTWGMPTLDIENRPIIFYGMTIHDLCPRRSYFDQGIFAEKLGDKECMFQLGCKGPNTKTDCPIRRWNSTLNWPVGNNTPCIGCAANGFPDAMTPFVKY